LWVGRTDINAGTDASVGQGMLESLEKTARGILKQQGLDLHGDA